MDTDNLALAILLNTALAAFVAWAIFKLMTWEPPENGGHAQ